MSVEVYGGGGSASNIKVIDIGSGTFNPDEIDFTQFALGDIVLVVGNK